jgi:hypothetical protein
MSNKTGEDGGNRKLLPSGARMPLLIALIVVGAVGGMYYAYYRGRVDYFTGRNLRLLSMLTAQIEGRVRMYEGFVHDRTDTGDSAAPPGMTKTECETKARTSEPRRSLRETAKGWNVALQAGRKDRADPSASEPAPRPCFAVPLASLLGPVFARRVGEAFDILIVAKDDGTVLYSTRQPPNSSSLLYQKDQWIDEVEEPHVSENPAVPLETVAPTSGSEARNAIAERESGSSLLIANLNALLQRKGWRGDTEAIDLVKQKMATVTTHASVLLGDNNYILFTQPYTFVNNTGTLDGKPESHQWIVCGLVSSSRFRDDVSAISTTIILSGFTIALLALCCWPFLRIALIHPGQALTITDVVLIVICTIIGAAVLTLASLGALSYRRMIQTADRQVERFSKKVHDDFQDNVERGMKTLEAAESVTKNQALTSTALSSQRLPPALLTNGTVANYPYIHAVAWVNKEGKQTVGFDRAPGSPLFDVRDREYFRLAALDRTWTIRGHTYVLEWVRSKSTGEVWAVLAKKPKPEVPGFAVIALATELIDITNTVAPPGVQLAIVDENGEVVYHSDNQRIGFENFFAEADRDRDLRSAVLARRAGFVSAEYWGEDQSIFVMPLKDSPWTLLTFRPRRLTRVLNVEGALLTSLLLLIAAMPLVLFFIAVLLISPRYRAPRLWPDVSRTRDYLRLSIILIGQLLLFWMNNYALAPWSAFFGILIIPALAIVTTYLVLHRGATRPFSIAMAVWISVNAVFVADLILAEVDAEKFPHEVLVGGKVLLVHIAVKAFLVLATLAAAVLTIVVLTGWQAGASLAEALRARSARIGYSRLYRLCGVLLLVICVVMPVAGFFTISRHVESQLLVKYGQLRAAADLEHRIDHLVTLNALTSNTPSVQRDIDRTRFDFLFRSGWRLNDKPSPEEPEQETEKPTIPPWAAASLPALYEDSLAIRPLFDSASADRLWRWSLNGDVLTLVRKIRFDRDVADILWPDKTNERKEIIITSVVPHSHSITATWKRLAAGVGIGLPLLAILWFATTFIARRIFLIDVTEPDWLVPIPLSPSLGEHIFLVRRDRDLRSLTENDPMQLAQLYIDVSFEDLDLTDGWLSVLEALDSSEPGRNVRIVDFEYRINDGAINEKKLSWFERLLTLPDRTVIIVSNVTPAYVMTTMPPPGLPAGAAGVLWYYERWRALLDRFVCITAEELELRHEERVRRQKFRTISQLKEPTTWLEKETARNSFLKQVGKEIEAEAKMRREAGQFDAEADREHLLDEIGERAETYYAGLWGSCHDDEKLLLFQLASHGLANARNRRLLRRLIARGLVRRDPNLKLFNETFRLYVLGAGQRENLASRAREQRGPSTWDSLRIPFFIVIISFILLLFATQKDLMTTTTALATALTTGLPMMMKVIGVFTERRLGADRM